MRYWLSIGASLIAWSAAVAAPELDECVRAALEGSPLTAAAEARAAAARAAVRQVESAWWPLVSVQTGYARTNNPPQAFMMSLQQRGLDMRDPAFDPNDPDGTGNVHVGLTARMRLLDFGRRASDRGGAVEMAQAGAAAAGVARNELAYAVSQGYYGLLQAQSLAAVQREQVRSLRESLRVARERLERGAAVRGDVLGLEVRLAQAEEELISVGSAVELAIAALNTAIGRELVPPAGLQEPSQAPVPELPVVPAQPSAADHPAAAAAAAAEAATRSAVARARAELRPTVSAFADFGWDTADLTDPQDSYLAGVMVEWDVFDGARRSAAVRQARAQRDAAAAEARRVRDGVLLEQRQAYLQARDARERLGVASKSIEAAEEGLRITRVRYEQGAAAVAELVDAEVALAAVRSRGVVARYSYLTALANIERARGTLAPAGAAR